MGNDTVQNNAVTVRSVTVVSIVSFAYLLFSAFLVDFKSDQVVLVVLFNLLFYASAITRKFITGFSIFVVYWIIYDYMKAFPNYEYSAVHIADIYNFEKRLFGIHFQGKLLTPNEYLRLNGTTFLDILTGIFYLCWIPVPMGFAVYLFFTRRRQFLLFLLTFVLVNFIGFIGYYTFPAAPPWYVQYYGFTFHQLTMGNTAGLAKFDAYFHVSIFKSIYAKGSNVFAAMPSLHSSYPVIVLYYALKNKLGKANIFFGIVMIGIWFSAVYLSHHYILDVLAGILCAIIGISLFNVILSKVPLFRKFIDNYEALIK
ncbi:MAG: inositol phosphorylceramide synthase [Mucilaginibacter sp.]|nr:inositol phosphorylceramide synthase [Mucilaginibacter sp.]